MWPFLKLLVSLLVSLKYKGMLNLCQLNKVVLKYYVILLFTKRNPDLHRQGLPRIILINGQVNQHNYLATKKAPGVTPGPIKLTY